MTPKELAAYIRLRTRTNSTTLPDTDLVVLVPVAIDNLAIRLIDMDDEDSLLVPATTGLVADQREYPFPGDILTKIKRVEAKLDGTNFIELKEKDLPELGSTVESEITQHYENIEGNAFFDIMRGSIVIYSGTITSVTGGLKLYYSTWPSHFEDFTSEVDMSQDPSTTTHGLPRQLHKVLADEIIIDWKTSREKSIPLTEYERNHEFHIQKALMSIKNANLDREIIGSLPPSSEVGNDGADY